MITINTNFQYCGELESLNQSLTSASRLNIALPTMQGAPAAFNFGILAEVPMTPIQFNPDLTAPRVAGAGKGRIKMAPDFDAPIQW